MKYDAHQNPTKIFFTHFVIYVFFFFLQRHNSFVITTNRIIKNNDNNKIKVKLSIGTRLLINRVRGNGKKDQHRQLTRQKDWPTEK